MTDNKFYFADYNQIKDCLFNILEVHKIFGCQLLTYHVKIYDLENKPYIKRLKLIHDFQTEYKHYKVQRVCKKHITSLTKVVKFELSLAIAQEENTIYVNRYLESQECYNI